MAFRFTEKNTIEPEPSLTAIYHPSFGLLHDLTYCIQNEAGNLEVCGIMDRRRVRWIFDPGGATIQGDTLIIMHTPMIRDLRKGDNG